MPPPIALLLYFLFILFLFRADLKLLAASFLKKDFKSAPALSNALWIPLIWLMILASRPVSLWLYPESILETDMDYISGNPINRTVFLLLIAAGVLILVKRGKGLLAILGNNWWIIFFFTYCGLSIFWSDFPAVSFRRWIKAIGNLTMVLIILTDAYPAEAVRAVIKKCAYILVPLSIVLIKYYPIFSRSYNPWTGEVEYLGVSTSKNMLGILCLVFGLFFFWNFLSMMKSCKSIDKKEFFITLLFLYLVLWLLIKANSATSMLLIIMGICILLGLYLIRKRIGYIGFYLIVVILISIIILLSFDVIHPFITILGRDETLTGRTDLWKEVLSAGTNPFIGTGYESFWLGDRMAKIWSKHWWHPNQAHDGYIEIYLNLGFIGLFLLMGIIISAYKKIRRALLVSFDYGIFRMEFLVIVLLHNITEASFKGDNFLWLILLLIAMDSPRISQYGKPENMLPQH